MIQKIQSRLLFFRYVASLSQPTENLQCRILAGRDVAFWEPAGIPPDEGYPVILFSHGLGGSNTQSTFLMRALARSGYLVLAPNHQDAYCSGTVKAQPQWRPVKVLSFHRRQSSFRKRDGWSDCTYRSRAEDIRAVLDRILSGELDFTVDPERVGLAGHSIGGYTALGLAGAWTSWKDHRIKAVLALDSHCTPYLQNGNLAHLSVPVMYQSGTRDLHGMPRLKRVREAYIRSSAPKYYVELRGAGHFAWTNFRRSFQATIAAYSVAFFDRHLKGIAHPDPLSELIDRPPEGVSHLQTQLL